MSLAAGTRLGPYSIIGPLGAGGMGEVYRGRDTRLERDVAIKVLPPHVASDPERRARFEREAKAVAALSHPNILAIHDVGAQDDAAYAVTELLEGETLRERLASGLVPTRKAVEIAVQIANGLAAAHDKGIVHRDLKPENVFITRDGHVKILDFGLAAHVPREAADAANSPTLAGGTEPGVVLGTVGYMAPEQVRGARVDHRADIFALGAVLFEMLTGRRAFQRDTAAETMTAILKEDVPDIAASGRQVPQGFDRIVRRCLEKNPDERLQAARDVAIALEAVSGSDVSRAVAPVPAAQRTWRRLAVGAALVAAGVGLGFLAARVTSTPTVPTDPLRFRQLTFRRGFVSAARFAPGGESIVYSSVWDSEPQRIYPVRLDRPRAGTSPLADAMLLAVSRSGDMAVATRPQQESILLVHGTLAQMALSGGAPRELLEDVLGADFAPDGRIAVVRSAAGRTRLEFPIGTVLYETAGWLSSPRFSHAGDRLAFHEHPLHDDDRGWPASVELSTGAKRNLTGEQSTLAGLAWAPGDDEVCFALAATIRCASVSKAAERVVLRGATRLMLRDIAKDGRMLAVTYSLHGGMHAGDATGREIDLSWQDMSFPLAFSADGTRLLFGSLDYGVNLRALDGTPPVRLADGIPTGLAPDGRTALALVPGVPTQLVLVPTGAGETRTLPRGPIENHTWAVWTPDGRRIVISATEPGHGSRLYVQELAGGDPRAITGEGVRLPAYLSNLVSPDGRLVIALGPDRQPALYPVAGGDPQPIPALGSDLTPIGWSDTPQIIFARSRVLGRLSSVFKVDLANGNRQPWKELGPRDPSGAPLVMSVQVSPDGERYAFMTSPMLSDLFLISGVLGPPTGSR